MVRPTRLLVSAISGLTVLSACAASEELVAAPDRSDVIAAYVDAGHTIDIATCVVGLGEREFELSELLPGAEVDDLTTALVAELLASCTDAAAILGADPDEPDRLTFHVGPVTYGDDVRFDYLWEECELGDGRACDRLWSEAPIGSDYEYFGVTCGKRFDVLDCSEELVLPPTTEQPSP